MTRIVCLVCCLMTVVLAGCSPQYYARRAALREQRLAERHNRRYAAEQDRMMELCGDPQRTFERGHNAGLARQAMDTSWVGQCPPYLQQQQIDAYTSGYGQGASRAPAQVVVAQSPGVVVGYGHGGGYAVGYGGGGYAGGGYGGGFESCRFSSDCGPSMSCRQWGDAGSVCMGFGGAGSPCWFGGDCLSGSCDGGARLCR